MYYIGVDVGGTFTDLVVIDDKSNAHLFKVETTPKEPSIGFMEGLKMAAQELGISEKKFLGEISHLAHGTTIATNAVLERKGAKVGLITTKGFGDTLFIQRSMGLAAGLSSAEIRHYSKRDLPQPIVPRPLIEEVGERIDYKGKEIMPLDEQGVRKAMRRLVGQGVQAIAVCFLWSFRNSTHERRAKEIAAEEFPDLPVSISSEVMPVIREYERTVSTVFNAFIAPAVSSYIGKLENVLKNRGMKGDLTMLGSSGGVIKPEQARRKPISLISSGPAGGIISSMYLGEALGYKNIITSDVGGTSFDVSLIVNGRPILARTKPTIKYLLHVPMIDVSTIGAGGGSIARVEKGELRVGPESAAANPGPVCYDRGGKEPTVTDADVVLGIIDPNFFLGGRMKLNKDKAVAAVSEKIAKPLGLDTIHAAAGIRRVIDSQMADLLRTITIGKGYDPRDFTLFAFGGGGPTHCSSYGAELNVKRIVVPYTATVHCAFGAGNADLFHVIERTEIMHTPMFFEAASKYLSHKDFNRIFEDMEREGKDILSEENVKEQDMEFHRSIDLRYRRQVFELTIPIREGKLNAEDVDRLAADFDKAYEELYGAQTAFRQAGIETTLFRVEALGKVNKSQLKVYDRATDDVTNACMGERKIYFYEIGDYISTRIYDGAKIGRGHIIDGPAIIHQMGTTIVIGAGQKGKVDRYLNVVIE
jgi:N-methylhydantoinase A